MKQSISLLLTTLLLAQFTLSQYSKSAASGSLNPRRVSSNPNYTPNSGRRRRPRRRGPNGQFLSDYEEELERQNQENEARELLENALDAQNRDFNARQQAFNNELSRANQIREANFNRNQAIQSKKKTKFNPNRQKR
jgi:hypothetical protein